MEDQRNKWTEALANTYNDRSHKTEEVINQEMIKKDPHVFCSDAEHCYNVKKELLPAKRKIQEESEEKKLKKVKHFPLFTFMNPIVNDSNMDVNDDGPFMGESEDQKTVNEPVEEDTDASYFLSWVAIRNQRRLLTDTAAFQQPEYLMLPETTPTGEPPAEGEQGTIIIRSRWPPLSLAQKEIEQERALMPPPEKIPPLRNRWNVKAPPKKPTHLVSVFDEDKRRFKFVPSQRNNLNMRQIEPAPPKIDILNRASQKLRPDSVAAHSM